MNTAAFEQELSRLQSGLDDDFEGLIVAAQESENRSIPNKGRRGA